VPGHEQAEGEESAGGAEMRGSSSAPGVAPSPSAKEPAKKKKKKRKVDAAEAVSRTWIPLGLLVVALGGLWIFRSRTEELKKERPE